MGSMSSMGAALPSVKVGFSKAEVSERGASSAHELLGADGPLLEVTAVVKDAAEVAAKAAAIIDEETRLQSHSGDHSERSGPGQDVGGIWSDKLA